MDIIEKVGYCVLTGILAGSITLLAVQGIDAGSRREACKNQSATPYSVCMGREYNERFNDYSGQAMLIGMLGAAAVAGYNSRRARTFSP